MFGFVDGMMVGATVEEAIAYVEAKGYTPQVEEETEDVFGTVATDDYYADHFEFDICDGRVIGSAWLIWD